MRDLKTAICRDICEENRDQPMPRLFVNETSLRLTQAGLKVMKDRYDHQEYKLEKALTGYQLIRLREQCGLPYYVSPRLVVLFTHRLIFKIALVGGITEWLQQHRRHS